MEEQKEHKRRVRYKGTHPTSVGHTSQRHRAFYAKSHIHFVPSLGKQRQGQNFQPKYRQY